MAKPVIGVDVEVTNTETTIGQNNPENFEKSIFVSKSVLFICIHLSTYLSISLCILCTCSFVNYMSHTTTLHVYYTLHVHSILQYPVVMELKRMVSGPSSQKKTRLWMKKLTYLPLRLMNIQVCTVQCILHLQTLQKLNIIKFNYKIIHTFLTYLLYSYCYLSIFQVSGSSIHWMLIVSVSELGYWAVEEVVILTLDVPWPQK